ncbi:hypothetical protein TcasGA2_TC001877 [Tribolium castaneum]|uniref:Hyaluronan/mRNA-binding protein domain-containing protein n=1 Tax=Tribolium castaneum TaxID=7070 RepID=D7EJN6_TRICA|nr:hypothetical protein TcasGA2_TC001877 [Tribolium castaneum]
MQTNRTKDCDTNDIHFYNTTLPQCTLCTDAKPNHQRSNVDGKPERNFNKFNNENREERNNRRNREERTFNGPTENREREERPRRENNGENFENRNRERGERGGRALGNKPAGPRGPRRNFDDRRGKREFDRQSGSDKTGVKPIDKRDGAGAHNWGSHKDVIEEADKPNDADQSWSENDRPETNAAPETKEETENETPVEEEPKELTLDEWKAQRAGRAKPQFNIRKAGEGVDPSQWKKMYELRKKENESESEDEEYDAAEYPQHVVPVVEEVKGLVREEIVRLNVVALALELELAQPPLGKDPNGVIVMNRLMKEQRTVEHPKLMTNVIFLRSVKSHCQFCL